MWSQVLAFVVGAGVAMLGQVLGHTLTSRRERRADFAHAVDGVVSAFAGGERALDDLTDAIERGEADPSVSHGFPAYVEDALGQAERTRVEMRTALFSLRVRVRSPESSLFRAFDDAFNEWELGFLKCKVIVREEEWIDGLRDARAHASRFRGEFYDVALSRAADAVGRS
jgi:hypothetical protein